MDPERRYWRERYDEAAARFCDDCRLGRWFSTYYYGMVQDFLCRALADMYTPGARVLDVCCGSGALIERLRGLGFAAVGVDLSEGQIRRLRQAGQSRAPATLVADANDLPFPDRLFNVVVSVGMLQCLSDVDVYFHELARVLPTTKGRVLVLFSPASFVNRFRVWRYGRVNPDMAHYRLHPPAAVIQALRDAGFRRIETFHLYYVFYAPWLRPLLRLVNRNPRVFRFLALLATSTVIIADLKEEGVRL